MLWILLAKIHRDSLGSYFGVAIFWTVIAVIPDYFFIVLLFNSTDYYKLDIYVYYALTFIIPILVGWYKFNRQKS